MNIMAVIFTISMLFGLSKTRFTSNTLDTDFDIVNFPFLDGDVPRRASYGVYISQLTRFAIILQASRLEINV